MPMKGGAVSKTDSTVTLIKWLFFTMLALLILSGLVIQYQNRMGREDPMENRILSISKNNSSETRLLPAEQFQLGLAKLRDPSPQERIRGIQILMAASPVEGPPYVQPLMADPDPTVRAQAVIALASFDLKGLGPQIIVLVSDPDPQVRSSALSVLPKYAAEAGLVYQLGTSLASHDPAVVIDGINAWKILAPNDPAGASGAIQMALASSDPQVISAAMGAISTMYQKSALAPFASALQGIQSRMAGQPPAEEAGRLLQESAS